ncbi:MAG: carbohydrate kinase [Clostridia bacterium]|nr:carbohydrate kinase [Clostridia bacterium]
MNRMDIVSLGELLVDLLPAGNSAQRQPLYEFNAGGAPANVASAAAKLGLHAGLISKVGDDAFGHMLYKSMTERNVQSEGIVFSQTCPTSLAVVHLNEDGDRSFSLFAHNPADMDLRADELPMNWLHNCRIFHFGARSLVANASREATLRAASVVHHAGGMISFDPNLRPNLWTSEKQARADALLGVEQADLIKLALEEMVFLYGMEDVAQVAQSFAQRSKTLVVTDGARGCYAWASGKLLHIPAYRVTAVDTTGAGDAFWTAFLYMQLRNDGASLEEQLRFASAAGALVTQKKGSMGAQPSVDEVYRFMEERNHE